MGNCQTCFNPLKVEKVKPSPLERELSKLVQEAAVLEDALHSNLANQHRIRKELKKPQA